jgi:hypothetical protein
MEAALLSWPRTISTGSKPAAIASSISFCIVFSRRVESSL